MTKGHFYDGSSELSPSSSTEPGKSARSDSVRRQAEFHQFLANTENTMEQRLGESESAAELVGRYSRRLDERYTAGSSLLRHAEENIAGKLARKRGQMRDIQADTIRYSRMLSENDDLTTIALQSLNHFTREESELQAEIDALERRSEIVRAGIEDHEDTYTTKRDVVDQSQRQLDERKDQLRVSLSTLQDYRRQIEEEAEG